MSATGPATPIYFYERDGNSFSPTRLARGPWDKRYQNGVALAGLCAYLVEGQPSLAPMVMSRLVIDLMRPIAMARFATRVAPVRDGKRLQLLQVELLQNGETMLRASALRVREGESPSTPTSPPGAVPVDMPTFNGERSAFRHIVETRLERGGLEHLGPGAAWVRFHGEIVPGVRISPFVQAAMASDFGSGLSAYVDWREWSFANVDIGLYLTRAPRGEWLRVASRTDSAGNGTAIVDIALADLDGEIGHAHQTLFINKRG